MYSYYYILSVYSIVLVTFYSPFSEKMLQKGFTLKEIQESLSENRYDEVCATYMLLKRDGKEVWRCCVCVCVCVCVRVFDHITLKLDALVF